MPPQTCYWFTVHFYKYYIYFLVLSNCVVLNDKFLFVFYIILCFNNDGGITKEWKNY